MGFSKIKCMDCAPDDLGLLTDSLIADAGFAHPSIKGAGEFSSGISCKRIFFAS